MTARLLKQWKWQLLIGLLIVVSLRFSFGSAPLLSKTPDPIAFGVYDPFQDFSRTHNVDIEHHFVPWRRDQADELKTALEEAIQNQRIPMISLEPWPWNWNGMTDETLLTDVIEGRYDETLIRALYTIKEYAPQEVIMRWGHEMEIVDQYPWSKSDYAAYIAAYRHIVALSHSLQIENISWLWSPAGNRNSIHYWPGEEYVDYIGISIYAIPEWHPQELNELPSFELVLQQKYWLSELYKKPLILSEVGVAGTAEEKEAWLEEAVAALSEFPNVKALVYFNQIQPDIVPLDIGQPQWQLSKQEVSQLINLWQQTYPSDRPLSSLKELRKAS